MLARVGFLARTEVHSFPDKLALVCLPELPAYQCFEGKRGWPCIQEQIGAEKARRDLPAAPCLEFIQTPKARFSGSISSGTMV